MLKVWVAGGRDIREHPRLLFELDLFYDKNWNGYHSMAIIHGAARGADTVASNWAKTVGVAEIIVPAQWGKWGRGAGPMRSRFIAEQLLPHVLMATEGGRGTEFAVKIAKEHLIPVMDLSGKKET